MSKAVLCTVGIVPVIYGRRVKQSIRKAKPTKQPTESPTQQSTITSNISRITSTAEKGEREQTAAGR
ncbi:hypothetical protein, partial [Escherichia coli]|uniref:hypothetical protein n=1 Tax=Escherichia coli TaxID=562 RepID=UPI0020BE99F4